MEGHGPNRSYSAGHNAGQAQMRREEILDQLSNQGQNTNFLQETGTQVKNIAQGAAAVGKGAAEAALNLARGTATGAANVAQGTGEAIKNTLGVNNRDSNTAVGGGGRGGTMNTGMDFGDTTSYTDFSGNRDTSIGGGTTRTTVNFGDNTTNTAAGGGRSRAEVDFGDTTFTSHGGSVGMGDSTFPDDTNYGRNPNTRI